MQLWQALPVYEKRSYEAEQRSPKLNFVRAHTSGTSSAGNQFGMKESMVAVQHSPGSGLHPFPLVGKKLQYHQLIVKTFL
jgi:hypothetical protein